MKFLFLLGFIFILFSVSGQEASFVSRNPKFKLWFITYLRQVKGEVAESYNYPEIQIFTNLKDALLKPDSVFILKITHHNLKKVPEEILRFKNLQYLDLSDNSILEIPSFIGEIKGLRFLYADNNLLTKVSNGINKCHFLSELSFSENHLQNLPLYYTELKELRYLDIRNNKVKNLASFVKILPKLLYLDIQNNPILNSENYKLLPADYYYLTNMLKEVLSVKKDELNQLSESQKQSYEAALKQMVEEVGSQKSKTDKKESQNRTLLVKIGELRNIININDTKIDEQKKQIKGLEKTYFYKIGKALSSYVILGLVIIILIILLVYNRRLYKDTFEQKMIVEEQKELLYVQHNELSDQNDELQEHKRLLTDQHQILQEKNEKLKEQQVQIQDQQLALIEANKKVFIANLVIGLNHDLATPVSNIALSGETIISIAKRLNTLTENDSIKYIEQLSGIILKSGGIIKEETHKIKEWIKGFKQVSSDQLKEELRTIELKDYIETFAHSMIFKLEKNNVHFSVNSSEDIGINTYPGFISQILQNLIDNSIEHGFSGENNKQEKIINIEIIKTECDIRIEYTDNGKGISKDLLGNIYDPYFSTSNQLNKGFGLYNVKYIVESGLEGKLKCESNQGIGTTFVISLPFNLS